MLRFESSASELVQLPVSKVGGRRAAATKMGTRQTYRCRDQRDEIEWKREVENVFWNTQISLQKRACISFSGREGRGKGSSRFLFFFAIFHEFINGEIC